MSKTLPNYRNLVTELFFMFFLLFPRPGYVSREANWLPLAHIQEDGLPFSHCQLFSHSHVFYSDVRITDFIRWCMLCLLHWQGDSLQLEPAGISLYGREVKVTFPVLSFFKTKHVSSRIIHTSYTLTTARINFHMI